MNDHNQHPGGNGDGSGNAGFEHADLRPQTVYSFLITLAVIVLIVIFIVNFSYGRLDRYFQSHQASQSPMKPLVGGDGRELDTPQVKQQIESAFPKPLLEEDERNELTGLRSKEEEQLNSYGWVDRAAGTAHIPITRAMQLIAQRGLPIRPSEMNFASPAKLAAGAGGRKATSNKVAK